MNDPLLAESDFADGATYPERVMKENEALKLADSLSLMQAACCIVGISPCLVRPHFDSKGLSYEWAVEDYQHLPKRQLMTVVSAICNAISIKTIKAARTVYPSFHDFEYLEVELKDTDYHLFETLIEVEELKKWLLSRNCRPTFFFGDEATKTPKYLDKTHPHFASQLAAAIQTWEAIQDPELRKRKSVKSAAKDWLQNHYTEFDLIHDGKRNESAIERIATLTNWEPGGGAPKTPE